MLARGKGEKKRGKEKRTTIFNSTLKEKENENCEEDEGLINSENVR